MIQYKTSKLSVHAVNIHSGGGKTLFLSLLNAIPLDIICYAQVDGRLVLPESILTNFKLNRFRPSFLHRFFAELILYKRVKFQENVLCFGNLPPLFKLRGSVVVFVQNRYLIEKVPLNLFALKDRIRIIIERWWLSSRMLNADEFVVQTPTMKRLLEQTTRGRVPIRVLPFVADPRGYTRNLIQEDRVKKNIYDFVYVASGEPHKNHLNLFEAWRLLADDGFFPSLCLTLDENNFADLSKRLGILVGRHGLLVKNLGPLDHQNILALYKKSGAAIYPSKFESFGLPLIEARQAGLPVLASELDYVRDILDPEQVFDPDSALSIARAVKRFMGVDEKPLPLLDASQFLESLFEWDLQ